ncbi:hypothetical protein ARMGADRAFT_1141296 [Armillaria gallica]|uniref:Reverse transcriptase zinc-binding domain-containing protein n=1 Tax=Armillaria gallica TaxID=47427 RepID=A0A2H3CVE8_ARMGA|nr:hypothetical protein ARMGADRAFT_1141296 [Armillaria gallica]
MSPLCLAGCDALETIHHVFVICPSFQHLRTDAADNIHFTDGEHWPRHISQYYLGILPPLPSALTTKPSPFQSRCIQTRLLHTWHSAAICLAGRIWGEHQKSMRMTRLGGQPSNLENLMCRL